MLLLAALPVRAEVAVPPLQARVTDLTGTLAPEQRAALERRLAAFEQQKGSQIAVLVVPTTRPETIEQYAIRVAEQWKLGRKGVDDGALLLVAKEDRELRIEVGYGLEGPLPDAIAKRIVSEVIVPRFRGGDFYGGIDAGVSRMISVIEGEPLPKPKRAAVSTEGVDIDAVLGTALFLVVAVGSFLRAVFGRLVSGLAVGGIAGVIVWFLFSSLILAGFAALAAFIIILVGNAGPGWHSRGGRGGWPGGSGWGGGGWSGGGGGGGWSGGGGGFG
ncbi:MAG TPA: YgcG family protein, partial [Burkholderiales bacterium]